MAQVGSIENSEKVILTQNFKARKWCFTLNNYENDDCKMLAQFFGSKKMNYIIGKEIGENGTPHLQGYFEAKNQIYFSSLKKTCPKWHLEKAKGNREKNLLYCSKDGNFETNFKHAILFQKQIENDIIKDEYNNVKWHKWQSDILKLLDKKPDSRTINVYLDRIGNIGKSYLCKYIVIKYKGVVICDGKKDNIFNQIKTMMDDCIEPKIVIIDVPRSNKDFINYAAIEQIKNGCIYSGKYEGGKCVFRYPHLLLFCNDLPVLEKVSADRWNIVELA